MEAHLGHIRTNMKFLFPKQKKIFNFVSAIKIYLGLFSQAKKIFSCFLKQNKIFDFFPQVKIKLTFLVLFTCGNKAKHFILLGKTTKYFLLLRKTITDIFHLGKQTK